MTIFIAFVNQATRQDLKSSRRNQNNNSSHSYQHNSYHGGGGSRDRGRGSSNGGPRCQVCGIPSHSALNCRNRFHHAYQPDEYRGGNSVIIGNYNRDINWYIDTGTTDHLTGDLIDS